MRDEICLGFLHVCKNQDSKFQHNVILSVMSSFDYPHSYTESSLFFHCFKSSFTAISCLRKLRSNWDGGVSLSEGSEGRGVVR